MSLRQFLASNLLLCIINIKFFFLSHLCCCPPLCTSGGQCERVRCLDQFLLVLIGRELRCTHVSVIFPVELIWRSAGHGKKEKKKGQTCDDREARFMFKNPAVGVQGYEVTLSHPVRSPASYGSMRVCFAVPSLLSSLSLAFLLLPPAESLIVNQQQQSPSPPATVTSSSHHDLYSAFSSLQLSPLAAASDFSLSHRPGCDLQPCDAGIQEKSRDARQWCYWGRADVE